MARYYKALNFLGEFLDGIDGDDVNDGGDDGGDCDGGDDNYDACDGDGDGNNNVNNSDPDSIRGESDDHDNK